jgi:hypothetical protein
MCLASLCLAAGCNKPPSTTSTSPPQTTAATTNNGSLATAPVDYLGTVTRAEQSAIKSVDLSVVNDAIRRFQVEVGRYPRDLEELVTEKYIPRIPPVPYGTKLDYDPSVGEVKVVQAQ